MAYTPLGVHTAADDDYKCIFFTILSPSVLVQTCLYAVYVFIVQSSWFYPFSLHRHKSGRPASTQ
eukprot:3634339-Pyramimonas_sp.AAC.1